MHPIWLYLAMRALRSASRRLSSTGWPECISRPSRSVFSVSFLFPSKRTFRTVWRLPFGDDEGQADVAQAGAAPGDRSDADLEEALRLVVFDETCGCPLRGHRGGTCRRGRRGATACW